MEYWAYFWAEEVLLVYSGFILLSTHLAHNLLLQDLQLVVELMIERVFEVVRNIVHHVLSPFKTLREFIHWAFFRDTSYNDDTVATDMATLGDSEPAPHKLKQVPQQPLNTDNRTCQDIITSLGLVPTSSIYSFALVMLFASRIRT